MNFNKDVILLLFTIQVLLLVIIAFLAVGLSKISRYLEVIRSHGCNIMIGTDTIADHVTRMSNDMRGDCVGYEETAEMYRFAGRMSRKYHALIVADYDVNMNIFNIFVMLPGTEKYIKIPIPVMCSKEEELEEIIKNALEQLRKETRMGLRKLRRQIASGEFDIHPKERMVWAYMIYECEDCGWMGRLYIENTLERNNGDRHKPVPFGIRCPKCRGFRCYDVSFLKVLPEERALKPGENYFKDGKSSRCGVPVIRSV